MALSGASRQANSTSWLLPLYVFQQFSYQLTSFTSILPGPSVLFSLWRRSPLWSQQIAKRIFNFIRKLFHCKRRRNRLSLPVTQPYGHHSAIPIDSTREAAPIGLSNIGNTCYMNSILQCLYHTEPLREYYLKENDSLSCLLDAGKNISLKFHDLLEAMKNHKKHDVDQAIRNLKKEIDDTSSLFQGHSQRDAQEFLTFVLDQLHEEGNEIKEKPYVVMEVEDADRKQQQEIAQELWMKHLMRNKSKIVEIFHGQSRTTTTCSQSHKELMFEPISQVAVPIFSSDKTTGTIQLKDCFTHFTLKSKESSTVLQWYCEHCDDLVECKREVELWKVPKILIVYLKRFKASSTTRYGLRKVNEMVDFPLSLDIDEYLASESPQKGKHKHYQLYGVVNHSGDLTFGHYYAYIKDISDGGSDRWYCCNDACVREMTSYDIQTKNAYVLFYMKKETHENTTES